MNDRSRKTAATVIGIIAASVAPLSIVLFSGIRNIPLLILLTFLAGTAANLTFYWLGTRLMRLQKLWSLGRPGEPVYAFSKLPQQEAKLAGGKGRVLANLYQMGFPVPDGCVLLTSAFDGDALTEAAWEKVRQQLARLRQGKLVAFAVRSSALSEDSAQASFAGEFESVLDVKTDEEIRAAIATVRQSRNSTRVQSYSQVKGLDQGDHAVAIVIQKLVPAEYAGVLFTANPLTGNLMEMTGNFVQGMGEKLVSGQVSATPFTFTRTAGTYHGPEELQKIAKTLHREAHEAEDKLGSPQDIEWATAGGKVYILQARPITTLNGYNPVTAEWNDTLKGNFLWSATNLMEGNPEVLTPLTASLTPYLTAHGGPALTVKGYPINGIIGGRFYSNISVQVTAFVNAFKGNAHRTYREMAGWWGEIPETMEIPLLPMTKQEWQQGFTLGLLKTSWQFSQYRRKAPEFLKQNRQKCAELREKIRRIRTGDALLAIWNGVVSPQFRDSMIHIVAAGSDVQIRLERELRALVGAEDANALLSNLSGQANRLESMGPMAGLGLVARGKMSREAYLENYGHRGVYEGEIAWPRPMEDPQWLDRQLEEWQRNPVDVEALMARQRAAYAAAWDRFCQKYPGKAKQMHKRLKKAAQAAQQRERVRSEATRGMTVMRAFALRAGELLGVGDGIFFLTINEVLSALAGDTSAFQYIRTRQEVHQRYRALPPYPAIIVGRFDPFTWAADPNRRSDLFDSRAAAAPAAEANSNIIHGAAGALGVVEGTVRYIDCIEESSRFQPGEVLVTKMTNIGWTPLFPRAAAIITDLGAPLSHAAIVARELGIPAVVGCGDATMRLKTGDRVRVDGGKGVVEILN